MVDILSNRLGDKKIQGNKSVLWKSHRCGGLFEGDKMDVSFEGGVMDISFERGVMDISFEGGVRDAPFEGMRMLISCVGSAVQGWLRRNTLLTQARLLKQLIYGECFFVCRGH